MSYPLAALAVYGCGVVAAISPCVLPLVPGYLGVLGGHTARDRRRNVAAFALTVATCFAAIGALANTAAEHVSLPDSPLRRVAGAVLIVAAASSIAFKRGHFVLALPAHSMAIGRTSAVALGVGCALAWTPCTGPLLGAVLTSAAGQGSLWRASVLLAAYSAGVMTPLFIFAAIDLRQAPSWLRHVGRRASQFMPLGLAAIGVLMLLDRYDDLISYLPALTVP